MRDVAWLDTTNAPNEEGSVNEETLRRWRRLDEPGLEVMHLVKTEDGIQVTSDVVHAGADPFGLRYSWSLDRSWHTTSLHMAVRRGVGISCATSSARDLPLGRWMVSRART